MRKILLLILTLTLAGSVAVAQRSKKGNFEERRQELMDYKMRYVAQEAGVPESDLPRFYDLFSQLENERFQAMKAAHDLNRKVRDDDKASDKDYEAASQAMDNAQVQIAEINKRYDAKFKEFLTSKQIFRMKQAEEKFRQKMKDVCKGKGKDTGKPKKNKK